jgi:GAF domain-containing protein
VAHKGFQAVFLDYLCAPHAGQAACGTAMSERTRVVVEHVETHPAFHDAQLQAVMRAAGVRAVQSTPLIDRNGTVFGVLSTHFRTPHQPTEHELNLIDIFARLLAGVDRMRVEVSAQRGT